MNDIGMKACQRDVCATSCLFDFDGNLFGKLGIGMFDLYTQGNVTIFFKKFVKSQYAYSLVSVDITRQILEMICRIQSFKFFKGIITNKTAAICGPV